MTEKTKDFKLFSFDNNKKDSQEDKKYKVNVWWDDKEGSEFVVDNLVHLAESPLMFLEKEDVDETIIINTDKTYLIKITAEK